MEHNIVNLQQNSQEWLDWRRNHIGASDAPVIQGVSPFKTPLQLWEEKIEGTQTPYNEFMERGKTLEPGVRSLINSINLAAYKPTCMLSMEYNWMCASLDGWDKYADIPLVEIKCPGETSHKKALNNEVPDHYYPQLQHQMIVADIDECLYVSYNDSFGDKKLAFIVVKRDKSYGNELIDKEYAFYQRLLEFSPPEPTDQDIILIEDPDALAAAKEFLSVSEQIKILEETERSLRNSLVSYVHRSRAIIGNVKVSKVVRQGNVQYDKIPELKGVDLNAYRKKPIESWRIAVS